MEKSNRLEVYISCVNGHFNARIKGFHQFKAGDEHITVLLLTLPQMIKDHIIFCRMKKYNYPEVLKGEYEIVKRYSIYAAFTLMPDLSLLSKETKIPLLHLKGYADYTRKLNGLRLNKIFKGINQIGEKICALNVPDFDLCSNENLLAEYSGISVSDIQDYKLKRVRPKAETQERLLKAMHQIGEFYQTLIW